MAEIAIPSLFPKLESQRTDRLPLDCSSGFSGAGWCTVFKSALLGRSLKPCPCLHLTLILTPPLLFCVLDFPANNIVKFLVGFTNKGTEDFIVESLDASFRYPQDYQFYIQNFTALPLNTIVPPQRQATFEYSFIPAEPMGGRPFGLVINLNYKDLNVRPADLYFVFARD